MRVGSRFQFVVLGLAALATGGFPAEANTQEPAETARATSSDTELSERQRRREERRQQRKEARSDQPEAAVSEAANDTSAFVVYVEPEIECRKVLVSGSRMPKEVCTEVSRQAATEQYQEEEAREFLRRVQERALTNPSDPNALEQNSARLPGF